MSDSSLESEHEDDQIQSNNILEQNSVDKDSEEDLFNPPSTGEGNNSEVQTHDSIQDDEFEVDDDDDSDSELQSKKKRKSKKNQKDKMEGEAQPTRKRKSKESEVPDSISEEVREIFKSKTTKYVDDETDEQLNEKAIAILTEMDKALEIDSNAHTNNRNNSFERIKFLEKLDKYTTNPKLLDVLYRNELLLHCEAYLLPYKDGKFPLYSIRMDVIKILDKIPAAMITSEDLSGKGSELIQVLQNPPELNDYPDCPLCKLSNELITKWKRTILEADKTSAFIPEERKEKMKLSSSAIADLNSKKSIIEKHLEKDRRIAKTNEFQPREVFINLPHIKRKHITQPAPKRITSEPT